MKKPADPKLIPMPHAIDMFLSEGLNGKVRQMCNISFTDQKCSNVKKFLSLSKFSSCAYLLIFGTQHLQFPRQKKTPQTNTYQSQRNETSVNLPFIEL